MALHVHLELPGGEPTTFGMAEGRWSEPAEAPSETIGGDLVALPGLVDAHAHLAAADGSDWESDSRDGMEQRVSESLAAGVMLALDKGWSDLSVVEMMDSVDVERRPDIEAAGVTHAVEGGYWPGFARNVDEAGIASSVEAAVAESRGWFKLIGDWPRPGAGPVANFTETELAEAVTVAGRHGARVAIHTMARDVPSMAVNAGVQSIEHGLFLTTDDLVVLGERGGMWVPTVLRMEAVVRQLGEASSGGHLIAEGLANVRELLNVAIECGVHVLTGTDLAVGTAGIAREALRLWEFGLAPSSVVDAVSFAGLRVTGRPSTFMLGAPANAVFFEEDPGKNPMVLAHPRIVIRHGKVIT